MLNVSELTEDDLATLAKVAAVRSSAEYGGDPLNLRNRRLKGAPEDFLRMVKLRKQIKGRERTNSDGIRISGTGLTEGKLREPTIGRLIRKHRINSDDLRAIQEIEKVYGVLGNRLMMRGYYIKEKSNGGRPEHFPAWFLDCYFKRYKPWAQALAISNKLTGDKTLSVVFDIVIAGRSGKEIDADNRWKHGTSIGLFISGIRSYAAISGWCC